MRQKKPASRSNGMKPRTWSEDTIPSTVIPEALRVGACYLQDVLPLQCGGALVVPDLPQPNNEASCAAPHDSTLQTQLSEATATAGEQARSVSAQECWNCVVATHTHTRARRTLIESIHVLTFSSFFVGIASIRTHVSVPRKDFLDLYEQMTGKGASVSEAYRSLCRRRPCRST